MKKFLIIFLLLLSINLAYSYTCECNSCSDCGNKLNSTSCDVVILNQSIIATNTSCINNPIMLSNKVFDCQGNSINGNWTASSGIYSYPSVPMSIKNFTIKNCEIFNFTSTGINIHGYSVSSNYQTTDIIINNNTIYNSNYGILLNWYTESFKIYNNTIHNTTKGIHIAPTAYFHIIHSNKIYNNSGYGIYIDKFSSTTDPYSNRIYNNYLMDNNINVYSISTKTNYWNTTYNCSGGLNIINGNCTGGNYYDNYFGIDNNGDGIGEIDYDIPGTSTDQDYLPLTNLFCDDMDGDGFGVGNTSLCTYPGYVDCDDTNATKRPILNNSLNNINTNIEICTNTYTQSQISATTNNIIVDCNNSWLINGTGNGISISGRQYVSILNCNIEAYSIGIYLTSSSYNTIENNFIYNNSNGYGIYIASLGHNIINNNRINNYNYGIFLTNSPSNTFNNNTIYNSQTGFTFNQPSTINNVVNNLTSYHNNNGILFGGIASNNVIKNSNISFNYVWDINSVTTTSNNRFIDLIINNSLVNITWNGKMNVKDYPSLINVPVGYKSLTHYLNITCDKWVYLNMTYTNSEIPNNVPEPTFTIWKYNNSWYSTGFASPNGVDTVNNYVYANITNFGSVFSIVGSSSSGGGSLPIYNPVNNTTISTIEDNQCDIWCLLFILLIIIIFIGAIKMELKRR